MNMPPAKVLIYGHAKAGMPIMLAAPQAALDLLLRLLVRERQGGTVVIAFQPVGSTFRRVGVVEGAAIRLSRRSTCSSWH